MMGTSTGSQSANWRPVLALALGLIVFYAAWVVLWGLDAHGYGEALRIYGIDPVIVRGYAAPLPFFDLQGVLSWPECARRGVDVLVSNPCDPIGRPANYSPLLAHPIFGGIGAARTLPLGFAIDLVILALLPFVIRPQNVPQLTVALLAAASPAVLYALERCNIDVIVFAALTFGILVAPKPVRHRISAAVGFLLGFVKFYPFCLLLLVLRERLQIFLVATVAAMAALGLFYFANHHAFQVMVFPGPDWFGDTFSARQVADGLADLLKLQRALVLPLLVIPAVLCARFAWRLSGRIAEALPRRAWDECDYQLLLVGSVIIVSCFVLQSSLYYRALFLLAALPGLWRLRDRAGPGLRRLIGWSIAGLIACLWAETVRTGLVQIAGLIPAPALRLAALKTVQVVILALREPLWWAEVTVLAGVVAAFLRQTPLIRLVMGLIQLKYGVSANGPVVVLAASHDPDRQT